MFNFRLKVFYSVATNLSFTKAAEELYITQPAVTKNIKEIERGLGIDVLKRNKSGVELTRAGEMLLHYAENALAAEQQLNYDISLLKDSFAGSLRLGASTTIGQYILPRLLAKFDDRFPNIKLSLTNNNTQAIEDGVISRELDLGIVEGRIKKKELKYIPFMNDELVVVVHSSQPLAQKDSITLDELRLLPLVLREIGSGSLDVTIDALKKQGMKLKNMNIQMHLGSTESIKTFLTHSNSIGIISVNALNYELKKGEFKIIDVDNFEIVRTFNFIYTQGQQNGFIDKFIDFASAR